MAGFGFRVKRRARPYARQMPRIGIKEIDAQIIEASANWPVLVKKKNLSLTGLARELARSRGIDFTEKVVAGRLVALARANKIRLPEGIVLPKAKE